MNPDLENECRILAARAETILRVIRREIHRREGRYDPDGRLIPGSAAGWPGKTAAEQSEARAAVGGLCMSLEAAIVGLHGAALSAGQETRRLAACAQVEA